MPQYNKVFLMGHLTRDPQLSYLPNQTSVVECCLAANRKYKKQDGSEGKEICYVDCQMFGKRAEVVNKYFKKGDPIFVEGRLKFDQWNAQDGSKKSKLRVFVENFEFVGSRQESKPKEEPEQSFEEKYNLNDAPPMDDEPIPF